MATPSPGGTLLGATQLQTAIDDLTKKVQDLTTAIKNMRQGGPAGPSSNWNVNPNGGGSGTNNAPLFPRPQAPPRSPYSAAQPGATPYGYNPKHATATPTYTWGGGSWSGAPGSPGGAPAGTPAPAPPTTWASRAAGMGSAATIGGSLGAIYTAVSAFGKSQFSNQVGMNAYAQQASLMAPTNMTFGQINQQLYGQAFGGNGNTPWAIANNAMDAAQGQLILNSAAGTWNPSSTGQGRNIMGAAGAFGYINPTLGLAQSAQMSAQLYAPQTSMMMRSLGYPVTPRVLGRPGQTNSTGAVMQGIMQRLYGGRTSISQKQLAANLAPGQTGFIDLQQLFGSNAGSYATTMEAYNRAAQKGMSASTFGTMLNQAVQNKGNAQQTLAKRGILDTSDLQSIKDLGAQRTARASDYSSSYNSALQASVGLLTQFNAELSRILKSTGADTPLGAAGGATAVMHNLTQFGSMGLGAVGGGLLAHSLFAKGAATILGKGGSGAAGTAVKGVGGRLGSIFGGMGASGAAAAGGTAGAGIGLGMLFRALSDAAAPRGTSAGRDSNVLQSTGNPLANLFGGFGGRLINMVSGIGGGATSPQTAQSPSNPAKKTVGGSVSAQAADAVHVAERYLGTPYVYGGDNPTTGFDCSGLVMYAYGQAGVKLPRTSEEQWAFLRRKAVPMKDVREGDIVFAAGSDGTPNSPGHEGLMVSSTELIQAPYTGADVDRIKYNPNQWSHAARPTGHGGGMVAAGGSSPTAQLMSSSSGSMGATGNSGGMFNSSEASSINTGGESSALGSSGVGGAPGSGSGKVLGSAQPMLGGTVGLGGKASAGKGSGATTKGLTGNKKIMNQAASKYGWGSGAEWNALYTLEMHEAGFNNTAQNPTSTAYGMGQFLDTTWATVGGHKTSNPTLQAEYMMKYIAQKYHDPKHAWAQYYDHPGGVGWYARGTANAYKGMAIVGENGPELISMRGGENIANAAQTSSALASQQMPSVNITIEKGAINVHGSGSGTPHDAGNSGREIAKQILAQLSSENIYAAIGVGHKL